MTLSHTRAGHEAGPDIVIDPVGVGPGVQVCAIVTDEAHSVTPRVIWGGNVSREKFEVNAKNLPTHMPW